MSPRIVAVVVVTAGLCVVDARAQTAFGPPTSSIAPVRAIASLSGLDPRVYLRTRNRAPDVVVELRARGVDEALAVLASPSSVSRAPRDAYAAGLKDDERAALRVREDQALLAGALDVVATSSIASTPRALAALRAYVRNADDLIAGIAAERLGQTRAAVVDELVALAGDKGRAHAVRTGALAGLSRHRSLAAAQALARFVGDDSDPTMQEAAIRASIGCGSPRAWRAMHDDSEGARVRAVLREALARASSSEARVLQARDDARRALAR